MTLDQMMLILRTTKEALPQWSPPEITRGLCNVFVQVLADHTDDEIQKAFGLAVKTLTEWPAPATVKRLCQGTIKDDKEIGDEIAGRIWACLGKFGHSLPGGAQQFMGPIGWEVVQRNGGWYTLCETATFDQQPSLMKAWREAAMSISKNQHALGYDPPPGLPQGSDKATLVPQ